MHTSVSVPDSMLEKFTTFGDLLRYLRRASGFTQLELSIQVGYSHAQISRLEQNLRLPDIPTIEARFVPALGLKDEPKVLARLLELAANVRREDAPGPGLCPYKGLNYFDEADADLFVGREALTSRLTERVLSLPLGGSPHDTRFLAVVGASGSGKSSLVRAGLVPALRWNKTSTDWNIHVLTPTLHPLESLAMSLMQEENSLAAVAGLMDDLAHDSRSLHLFAKREMKSSNGSHVLLVVDQFEELFALCRSETERTSFIGSLLAAASEADGPVIVAITLRADFYAHCANYIQLREALAQSQEYIGAMNHEELGRAIEEPARRGRWELEPGLVDLLLHDVGHEPGALPLLSHALFETWQRRQGRMMTLSGYASSGGVRGAIAETAEAVFADQFTSEQRAIARRIFLRLTELGEEAETGDTRRRATFKELILKPEEAVTTQNVLKTLADARLIITSEDSAEVAHEALIREWPTLRGWLEDNREGLRLHRHLTEAAQEWMDLNRESDLLYRGARLAQALEWASGHQDEMNALEREFLETSQAWAEKEINEKEAQRQRELDATRRLAESERRRAEEQTRSAKQLRKRAAYLSGAFIAALIMAIAALFFSSQTRIATRLATSRELAAASISNLNVDPELSILLALEALTANYSIEAEDALHKAVQASRVQLVLQGHEPGAQLIVAFSPDGNYLASSGTDEVVKVWDSTSGKLLLTLAGHYVSYSPDGKQIATVRADGTVKIWNAVTGVEIPLAGPIHADLGVVFSPEGTRLATVTGGNLPRVWDLRTGTELASFPGHTDYVSFVFFSPDGRKLLTSSDDGTARLWDVTSGKQLLKLSEHPGWVWSAAFSPDGKHVATVSENDALLWDAITGKKLLTLTGHTNSVYAVAFSPDGSRLATGSLDRKVKVWDATTGQELFSLAGHSGAITSISFSPDGRRLAAGSDDGTVRTWDLTSSHEMILSTPNGPSQRITFNSDGTQLATADAEGTIRIVDTSSGKELYTLPASKNLTTDLVFAPQGSRLFIASNNPDIKLWDISSKISQDFATGHTGEVTALAINPDGTRLATASDDYKVKIWDTATLSDKGIGSSKSTLNHPTKVLSVAFGPDGSELATGVLDGTARVWNIATGKEIQVLRGHNDGVLAVTFAPDGKQIATASLDGTAKLWDAATGQELLTLRGHTDRVVAVAFNPDGRRIATASWDGTARLWDASTGQELLAFFGDGSGLSDIAFSPDGTRLVTSSNTGIHIYLMQIEKLIATARTRLTRSLTVEECQKYLHHISEGCTNPISIPTTTSLPPAQHGRVCQVTNTGDLYDRSFNEIIYNGSQNVAVTLDWEANVLQSVSTADFGKNLREFLRGDCDLIVGVFSMADAIRSAAETNPDQKFQIIDFPYDQPLDNVWAQNYATDQAAFLAGYVAASATKSGKVGVFGGIDIPSVTDFMDGFGLGIDYYNQKNGTNIELIGWDPQKHEGLFIGGFCCTTEGRQMARQLLDEGVDIILPVAGTGAGWGAGAEVQEHGNAWLIGVDTDWTWTYPEFKDILLTSIEKRFDVSVIRAAKAIVEGNFTGGVHLGTLETGEVSISPFHALDSLISAGVRADLEQIRAEIIAGKIKTKP